MSTTEVTESNRQLVTAAFEDWSNGGVLALVAPDVTWTVVGRGPIAGTYTSRDAFLEQVIRPMGEKLAAPMIPQIKDIYADGDTVIAVFNVDLPTHAGPRYLNDYTWILHLENGQIVRAEAFFDPIAFAELWA
jgi:ketosteroid isomerase-like protein